ncbi:hypothetical protein BD01_1863 [Thermococcus nautili]|uniref:Uncharacterized protein n=1 Tax=Thermococcus nautili TaxID=195522 RepID=W8P7B7_9EURY|nr:hypothetical protein BD01_1863 [Thermococcus nautili]
MRERKLKSIQTLPSPLNTGGGSAPYNPQG